MERQFVESRDYERGKMKDIKLFSEGQHSLWTQSFRFGVRSSKSHKTRPKETFLLSLENQFHSRAFE